MAKLQMLRPRIAMAGTRVTMADQSRNPESVRRVRGRAWMTIRDRIMRRDCGLCQECKRRGKVNPGTEIDHIIALTNSGTNDDENLETICVECHATKTNTDLGYAPRVTTGLDGWPAEPERSREPVWKRQGYR